MEILAIYKKLYKFFGPQGWWPGDSRPEIIIGAILTQATNWKNVEKAIENLRKENLIDFKKLVKTPRKKLEDLIKPSGFYNVKAKRLHNMCKWIIKNYQILEPARHNAPHELCMNNTQRRVGSIGGANNLIALHKQMLDINGLGPETVDSILLYAFNKPIFVIDAYAKRVFDRCLKKYAIANKIKNVPKLCDRKKDVQNYQGLQKFFMKNLPKDVKIYQEFHALIVKLGKEYCKIKPDCQKCPLGSLKSSC